MKLKQQHIIFLLPILLISIGFSIFSLSSTDIVVALQTKQVNFKAGDVIALRFTTNKNELQLYCHGSYGTTIIDSDEEKDEIIFAIPEHFTRKRGVLDYTLVHKTNVVYEGKINIQNNIAKETKLETYIGPPDIIAGGKDYTMIVVVPTDFYDNPIADSTAVKIKHQFLDIEKEEILFSKDFIAWDRIFSFDKSGRILASNEVNSITSKEFAVEVFPANARDFVITSQRRHAYGDGNQITTFITSVIRDRYDNIISDGTLITFFVKNMKGMILKTNGITLNGIAKGKLLHPDHTDQWEVKAYVTGIAESNMLSLTYEKSIEDFEVNFGNKNRTITIGPLQSFMGQLIPDGAVVKCVVIKEGQPIETKIKTSSNGFVKFIVTEGFYPSGIYDFRIEGVGVYKEFNGVAL